MRTDASWRFVRACRAVIRKARPRKKIVSVGWVAPGRYQAEVEWVKFTISGATPTIGQKVVARFLESGGFEQHLRRMRREYARNVELLSNAVMRYFPEGTRITRPSGGFVLWVEMPAGVDTLRLHRDAIKHHINTAPGALFSVKDRYRNCLRMNCGVPWTELIETAIRTFFPGLDMSLLPRAGVLERRSLLQRVLEAPFALLNADRLDDLLMRGMQRVWARRYPQYDQATRDRIYRSTKHESRAYAGDFEQKVLSLYEERLREFGLEDLPATGIGAGLEDRRFEIDESPRDILLQSDPQGGDHRLAGIDRDVADGVRVISRAFPVAVGAPVAGRVA